MSSSRSRPPLELLAVCAIVLLAVVTLLVERQGTTTVVAQETELPSVPLDSVEGDFIPPVPAPGTPGVSGTHPTPPAPPAPRAPGAAGMSREELERKYHIKAGANDVVQVGEDIVIEPGQHVLGHVFAMGGNITVAGMVDDDVVALGGDVTIEPGATIRGDAVSVGGTVHKDPNATVLGSSVSVGAFPRGWANWEALNVVGHGMKFVGSILKFAFWLFMAWIVILLSSSRSARVIARIEERPLPSIGWGFLAMLGVVPAVIAVAFVAVLLVVTIIGIPIAVLVLLGFCVGLMLLVLWGGILGATAVGGWLVRRLAPRLGAPSLMRNALIGVGAFGAIGVVGNLFNLLGTLVPPAELVGGMLGVLGFIVLTGAIWAGMGGILMSRAGQPAPLPGSLGGPGPTFAPPIPPAGPIPPPMPPVPAPGAAQPAP
ncbi:MAG: hypothetical protein ACREOU_00920 [Candidatus Eiseniibacteriota bacterium]